MELTVEQKRTFAEMGFVRLPGVIPRERTDTALRAINASLGDQGMPPDDLPTLRARSYCPELTKTPPITDLLNGTPLWEIVESAIGMGKIGPVNHGQIALRFPSMDPPRAPHPHIDGMYTPTNGVPKGTIANFTALVGVMLSDVPDDFAGNFTVWPGTHRLNEEYFRAHGPEALLEGMPQVNLPAPVQTTGRAGDAVLCHYLLSHGIAGNSAPHIRYAIYFRLSHVDHETMKWESMTDMWREWDGMRDVVGVTRPRGGS